MTRGSRELKRDRRRHGINRPNGQLGSRPLDCVALAWIGGDPEVPERFEPRILRRAIEWLIAEVAELVDALDLGSSGVTRPGSSPGFRMLLQCVQHSALVTFGITEFPR
jgi:hypothetical protein